MSPEWEAWEVGSEAIRRMNNNDPTAREIFEDHKKKYALEIHEIETIHPDDVIIDFSFDPSASARRSRTSFTMLLRKINPKTINAATFSEESP